MKAKVSRNENVHKAGKIRTREITISGQMTEKVNAHDRLIREAIEITRTEDMALIAILTTTSIPLLETLGTTTSIKTIRALPLPQHHQQTILPLVVLHLRSNSQQMPNGHQR